MKRWILQNLGEETGQALIQVSIALILLLGCAALAIDISYAYAQRRNMQNAADAGALAGAYQMCFVNPTQNIVEDVAINYATGFNLAEWASVDLSLPGVAGGLITVTTQITTPTFIAGVIGFPEITAGAQAVAACGAANSGCGLAPIGFSHNVYDTIACDEFFYVWDDGAPAPGCETSLIGDYTVLPPGGRAWLQFPRPVAPYPDEYACANNCGANQLRCIVENGYDGQISISPSITNPICLPEATGVIESVRIVMDMRVPYQTNIALYDLSLTCAADDVLGTCSGDPYPITGLGCVNLVSVTTIDIPATESCAQRSNVKVILAQKRCDCTTTCGSTDGRPGNDDDVKAVNLLK